MPFHTSGSSYRNIGEHDVLKEIAVSVGLDAERLDEVFASPERSLRHDLEMEQAHQLGIRAVPSLSIDGQVYSGMPDPARLRELIVRLSAASLMQRE